MEKIQWLNQLNQMENPMMNLLSVMHQAVANMGVAKYAEVFDELDKAKDAIRKAVDLATEITYQID